MPTNPSSTASLPCEQCGYLNEPERVYCHNCGSKLDRSLLPKTEAKKSEDPTAAKKRISKMTNPSTNWFFREVKALFTVAISSAAVAAIILIGEKPDGVPEAKKEAPTRLVSSDMMEALESPSPRPLSFTEDEINQYLKQVLKSKEGAIPGVQFDRAFVSCLPGVLRITSQQSVFGFPLYSSVDHQLAVKEGKFATKIVGGSFGRLSIDPRAMEYSEIVFQNLWESLARERKQMDKMQSVTVVQGRVDLVTKGAAAVR